MNGTADLQRDDLVGADVAEPAAAGAVAADADVGAGRRDGAVLRSEPSSRRTAGPKTIAPSLALSRQWWSSGAALAEALHLLPRLPAVGPGDLELDRPLGRDDRPAQQREALAGDALGHADELVDDVLAVDGGRRAADRRRRRRRAAAGVSVYGVCVSPSRRDDPAAQPAGRALLEHRLGVRRRDVDDDVARRR